MKGVLVILDGLGDLPCKQLDEKTPLEAANMSNLDFLATRGEMGYMYTVKQGFIPTSDEAIVSIFGNDINESSRGQLEARGVDGLKLVRGDLALRVDFATVDSAKTKNLIDRRAGRTLTTAEAEILSKALNKIKLPCDFVFKSTIQHRGVLVLRGGFSDNFTGNDAYYLQAGSIGTERVVDIRVLDDEDNTQYTVNILKEFLDKAAEVLENHPVNVRRRERGLLPANYLLVRGPGVETPKLKFYRRWMSVSYMPLEIGFAKTSGMKSFSFDYPKLKSIDSYENLWDGLREACAFSSKTIKKNQKDFDYVYVHLKETDDAGHDNKPFEKKEMLEYIDKTFFKFLRDFATTNGVKVVVTGDHSTPCKLKSHSADPVPVMLYNASKPKTKASAIGSFLKKFKHVYPRKNPIMNEMSRDSLASITDNLEGQNPVRGVKFCEKTARNGSLGLILGNDFLQKIGFDK